VGHDNLESCFASTVPQPPYSCRLSSCAIVSTTTCECAFGVHKLIKTKFRNKLGSKNLDAMLRIALEGPDEEVDDIIGDAIPLWKKDSKYRFLYANPFSYLNSPNTVSVSDVSSSFGAIDTNGNGTQIS
jgi:hypothetical protein